jgi:hypothetical protein
MRLLGVIPSPFLSYFCVRPKAGILQHVIPGATQKTGQKDKQKWGIICFHMPKL